MKHAEFTLSAQTLAALLTGQTHTDHQYSSPLAAVVGRGVLYALDDDDHRCGTGRFPKPRPHLQDLLAQSLAEHLVLHIGQMQATIQLLPEAAQEPAHARLNAYVDDTCGTMHFLDLLAEILKKLGQPGPTPPGPPTPGDPPPIKAADLLRAGAILVQASALHPALADHGTNLMHAGLRMYNTQGG